VLGRYRSCQEQKIEDYVQAVTASLQKETGKAPQPQEIVSALNRIIVGILEKGDYRTGETVAVQTYRFAEQKLGPDNPSTLSSVNNLAALYKSQGRYGEAEPLYQRALAAREKVPGPEHPDTLRSVNNLAGLYYAQGRYGEAEPLYQRALAAREKVLGPEHPDTLISVNNLAELYEGQGRYGEAEPLLQRRWRPMRKCSALNTQIPCAVSTTSRLYMTPKALRGSEPLYQRALAAREKVLGPEHPHTLSSVNNLAALYYYKGATGKRNRSISGRWRPVRKYSAPSTLIP